MSLRDHYTLAHSAQCKLKLAVNRPDRNWRFVVGHAVHLDSLMLRIVEIEEGIEKADHSADVRFKGAGDVRKRATGPSPLSGQKKSRSPPPPPRPESDSEEEDTGLYCGGEEEEEEEAGLSLTRFPSGSARPPQPPPLDPSDDDSSSDEEYEELLTTLTTPDPDVLRSVTKEKGDEHLTNMYNSIKKCPCHKSDVPAIENMWELPQENTGEKSNVRTAVVEIRV